MAKNVQQKVSETLLRSELTVSLGGKEYKVAPPSIGTLVYVSDLISRVPKINVREGSESADIIAGAKEYRILPEIIATLILGVKEIRKSVEPAKKRFFMANKGKKRTKLEALMQEINENAQPSEIKAAIVPLLESLQLGDFFVVTTFLNGINITKPTKVENATGATASGQS